MKKIISALLVLTMMFAFTACGGGGNDDPDANVDGDVTGKKELNVGTSPDFPPFEYIDETTGEMMGFDLELIAAIAEDQGYTVKFTSLGFDFLVPAVKTGNIDIIASGCTITDEKAKEVNFTDSYVTAGLALAVRNGDTSIKSVDDLQGKKAAVQIATTGYEEAQALLDAGVLSDVVILNTVDLVMQELINGGVDCVINDLPVTKAYIEKQPGKIEMAGDPLTSEDYGFIVALENTELLDQLNAGLKNVIESGKYDELVEKYLESN